MMTKEYSDQETIDLLNQYSNVVRHVARSAYYSSAAIDLNDLYQVGELAVLQAVKSYDPSCGTSIKSFVSRVVRNAVFREAARFLGVFTVDHRVTNLATEANKLHNDGRADEEIAVILSDRKNRSLDAEHVRDLRIAYGRRQHSDINNDSLEECLAEESTILELVHSVAESELDHTLIDDRILGDMSIKELSRRLSMSQKRLYVLENILKDKIKQAIKDATE